MVLVRVIPLFLLAACTSVSYTASCDPGDVLCQRNQDAQTLFIIGQDKAALQLLCEDPSLRDVLGEQCTR